MTTRIAVRAEKTNHPQMTQINTDEIQLSYLICVHLCHLWLKKTNRPQMTQIYADESQLWI
jgi:hypothetical protein